jgi:hypothetical protein
LIPGEDLYCEICVDSDVYLGKVKNKRELRNLIERQRKYTKEYTEKIVKSSELEGD